MIDTRTVLQEVHDQLLAAAQKGQEQFRRSQERARKGRETLTVAARTGTHLARAVVPDLPSPEELRTRMHELTGHFSGHARELSGIAQEWAGQTRARRRDLADSAQDLAERVVTAQRKLAGKAVEIAGPLVADGVTRLTQVTGSHAVRHGEGPDGRAEPASTDDEPASTDGQPGPAGQDARPGGPVTAAGSGEQVSAPAETGPTATAGRAPAAKAKKGQGPQKATATRRQSGAGKPRASKK